MKYLIRLDTKLRRFIRTGLLKFITDKKVIWLFDIDVYTRHNDIVKELKKNTAKQLSILDVGGRVNSLAPFLPEDKQITITVLNYNHNDLKVAAKIGVNAVQGDGACLPFKDNQFDIVTSITVLEHVPKIERKSHLEELFRVAKKQVLINIPLGPAGDWYERRLYALSLSDHIRFMTKQHIDNSLPYESEIKECFPSCKVKYIQNASVWLTYMVLKQIPFAGIIFPRVLYELFLRFINLFEPFYDALFIIDKLKSEKE